MTHPRLRLPGRSALAPACCFLAVWMAAACESSSGPARMGGNHGGDHCRAPAELYAAAWTFMKAHPFGVAPEPYASGVPASFPGYCSAY